MIGNLSLGSQRQICFTYIPAPPISQGGVIGFIVTIELEQMGAKAGTWSGHEKVMGLRVGPIRYSGMPR